MDDLTPLCFADEAHANNAYVDPTDPESRPLVGSTTVIKKGIPPYLVPWAAKLTATYAVDTVAQWSGLEREAAIDLLKKAPDRSRDEAGRKGTIVHHALHLHSIGEKPDEVLDVADKGYLDAGLRFLDEWQPEVIWAESTVFHPAKGYAGTLDLIAKLPGLGTVIADYKTGRGIYAEVGVQLASYRYAAHAINAQHRRVDIPEVDGGVVIHLKGDGTYDLRPVRCGESEFEAFLAALRLVDYKAHSRSIVGVALPRPDLMAVLEPVEDGPGIYPDRRSWIVARVQCIVSHDGGKLLAQWWPEGVPTLKAVDTHSDEDIDAIVERCRLVEQELSLPFFDADPVGYLPVPVDDPMVQALLSRYVALPAMQRKALDDRAKRQKIPRIVAGGPITRPQLTTVGELIAKAEAEALRNKEKDHA